MGLRTQGTALQFEVIVVETGLDDLKLGTVGPQMADPANRHE
jgi:hypothetical protein